MFYKDNRKPRRETFKFLEFGATYIRDFTVVQLEMERIPASKCQMIIHSFISGDSQGTHR